MRLIDEKGRLPGRLNVVDLFVVVLVCLVVAVGYVKLAAPHRITPQHLLPKTRTWVEVEVRAPAWLAPFASTGLVQRDPRSGEVVAEIVGCRQTADGAAAVAVQLLAARDAQGRLIFGDKLVVPGQWLLIETDGCVVEGAVCRVGSGAP